MIWLPFCLRPVRHLHNKFLPAVNLSVSSVLFLVSELFVRSLNPNPACSGFVFVKAVHSEALSNLPTELENPLFLVSFTSSPLMPLHLSTAPRPPACCCCRCAQSPFPEQAPSNLLPDPAGERATKSHCVLKPLSAESRVHSCVSERLHTPGYAAAESKKKSASNACKTIKQGGEEAEIRSSSSR